MNVSIPHHCGEAGQGQRSVLSHEAITGHTPTDSHSICHTPPEPAASTCTSVESRMLLPTVTQSPFCLLPDATLHLPVSETHPYENQDPASMPADTGYGCKMVDGVMHVYTTRSVMEK